RQAEPALPGQCRTVPAPPDAYPRNTALRAPVIMTRSSVAATSCRGRPMTRLSIRRATRLATLLACACPGVAQAQVPAPEPPDKAKDLAFAHAQVLVAPEVPDAIKVQPGAKVLLRARATGVQICVGGTGQDGEPGRTRKARG